MRCDLSLRWQKSCIACGRSRIRFAPSDFLSARGEGRAESIGIVSSRISYWAWITVGFYGAGVFAALVLAYRAGSVQIAMAARLIAISWLFSLQFWIMFDGDDLALSYLALDLALAAAFYHLSRGRWFPAPLFFLHATTVIFNFYVIVIDQGPIWMIAVLNRSFELALAYIIACAVYRIRRSAG